MIRLTRFVLAAAIAFGLSAPAAAAAQAPPDLPPGCQAGALPTGDAQYPTQLILICIPPVGWNGQLIVYAHGYVPPQAPLALPLGELTLPDGTLMPAVLLSQGFAFATSSYSKNGYAVEQAGRDLNALLDYFTSQLPPGSLQRTFIAGASEGGLITTMLVERFPDRYAGGLALCGPVGGMPFQIKYLGDFRVVFDYFFHVFPFGANDVPQDAYLGWDALSAAAAQAIAANPHLTDQLFDVTRAARDPGDPAGTAVTTAVGVLFYSVWGTNDLKSTAGGQPFDNRLTWYFGSDDDLALNRGVERVASSRAARRYVQAFYQTSGRLDRPLVTLHNTLDPAVPFRHELLYAGLAALRGRLRNLTILPVTRYGHCNFTLDEVLGAFGLLLLKTGGQLSASLQARLPSLPAPYGGDGR